MIRRAVIVKYFQRGGERRQIGQLAMVNFTGWNRVERYEPEGSRGPEGERRLENRRSVLESNLATGNER